MSLATILHISVICIYSLSGFWTDVVSERESKERNHCVRKASHMLSDLPMPLWMYIELKILHLSNFGGYRVMDELKNWHEIDSLTPLCACMPQANECIRAVGLVRGWNPTNTCRSWYKCMAVLIRLGIETWRDCPIKSTCVCSEILQAISLATALCVSNCSLDQNDIGPEGAVALGEALTVNQTLQEMR